MTSAPPSPLLPPPVRTLTVGEAQITAYRAAARPGLAPAEPGQASPVHAFVLAHAVAEDTVAALTAGEAGPVSVVHLGQDIRLLRPVRPGERVTVRLDLLGVRKEPRGARIALRVRLYGQDGPEPFAELVISALLVGATALEPFGDITGAAAAPAPLGAGEPQTATHEPTADWISAYAHASGDLNPIHLDAAAAREAGFETVIAHGMGVVALAVEEAVDRFAGGDAARVRGLGCRFSAPVLPGVPLEIVLQPDARAHVVRFTCKTQAGVAVKGGWIEFARGGADA
ncbi:MULTISPECIES: MaoC/PaaZ C-terminal domain-containing protein [unclassified Streptomyces]|uniref:MaoC/PaaZ C-terminal domain-containing protein n=1 Tax=unclassified Streptomyces TaxID=2593676 RepID=UPI002E3205AB|nr:MULTISPECIES: MaoC/PaaZ C-terminal domain-containing protein [unclassified Streptomyces]WUC67879.1 MaoC/PaaZ C-terminal domain-containing protein [Streptomyces sp. NBC_00539]